MSPGPPTPNDAPTFKDLQQAAEWFAVLQAESASDADRRGWQRWLATGPPQQAAWNRVESIAGDLAGLAGLPARHALDACSPPARRRRDALRALGILPVAGLACWMGARHLPLRSWMAAHRTDTGEQQTFVLADGSRVWLNTASSADVDYSDTLRRIVLHRGEVVISSGHDDVQPARPLVVDVPQGRIKALGTRFAVRHEAETVRVAVFEGAVEIQPESGGALHTLRAGEQAWLRRDGVEVPLSEPRYGADWLRGTLVADGMRLGDFIAELGRYRAGYLACAPEVADLRIVGAYPLADTDRVLAALQATLPVRVRQTLPWWTVVEAKPVSRHD